MPSKFPYGEMILKLVPQVVIDVICTDNFGNPMSVETLTPATIWSHISVENYMKFRIYCLEYLSMILEQFSEDMEKKLIAKNGEHSTEPFGCIAQLAIIRCMKNLSMSTFTNENKDIASKIMVVAQDNYPEVMAKCYIVNTPWVFTPIYSFAKMFMAPKTIAKISLYGHDFLAKIAHDVPNKAIPDFLGGSFTTYNGAIPFDLREGGPLWCEDMRAVPTAESTSVPPTVFQAMVTQAPADGTAPEK